MKNRLVSTTLAAIAGVGLLSSVGACSLLGGGVPTAEVGFCTNLSDLQGTITEFVEVDCSEPHDAQLVGKFDMEDGDYPGDDAVGTAAEEGCVAAFEDFVGISYDESTIYLDFVGPNQQTWDEANDREVLCFAYLNDGTTTTESWEGAAI